MRGANMFQTARTMVFADGMPLHSLLETRWSGAPRWGLVAADELGNPFLDGGFVLHDDLQFVGLGQVFVQWQGLPFGGEGDPVEVAADQPEACVCMA